MNQRERAIAEDKAGQQVILAAERAQTAKRIKKAREVSAQIFKDIESSGRPIHFPHFRHFSDLFESATVVEDLSGHRSTDVHVWKVGELLKGGKVRKGTGRASLSSFCSVSGVGEHACLDVRPRQAVTDMIGEKMMLGDQYVINLEIIVREGGTALVTAHYNLISGSRWLAIIHADTIPGVGR